jgi:hypothetical protein
MKSLLILFGSFFIFSCSDYYQPTESAAVTAAIIQEYSKELDIVREQENLHIKNKRSVDLTIKSNEHSKDSHGNEKVISLKFNMLEWKQKSWGHHASDPVNLKAELSDEVLERVYLTIEALKLNQSYNKEFKSAGYTTYTASLNIDKKQIIDLEGGAAFNKDEVANNMLQLAGYLEYLANGNDDTFMKSTEKYIINKSE